MQVTMWIWSWDLRSWLHTGTCCLTEPMGRSETKVTNCLAGSLNDTGGGGLEIVWTVAHNVVYTGSNIKACEASTP